MSHLLNMQAKIRFQSCAPYRVVDIGCTEDQLLNASQKYIFLWAVMMTRVMAVSLYLQVGKASERIIIPCPAGPQEQSEQTSATERPT